MERYCSRLHVRFVSSSVGFVKEEEEEEDCVDKRVTCSHTLWLPTASLQLTKGMEASHGRKSIKAATASPHAVQLSVKETKQLWVVGEKKTHT